MKTATILTFYESASITTKHHLSLYDVLVVVCVGADQLAVELRALVSAGRSGRDLLAQSQVHVGRREDLRARESAHQQEREEARHLAHAAARRGMMCARADRGVRNVFYKRVRLARLAMFWTRWLTGLVDALGFRGEYLQLETL